MTLQLNGFDPRLRPLIAGPGFTPGPDLAPAGPSEGEC